MMRIIHTILFFVILCFFTACKDEKKLPDMREVYDQKSDIPFGTSTARFMVESLYEDIKIKDVYKPFENVYMLEEGSSSILFSITRQLVLSEADTKRLLDFVRRGNVAFIASYKIDTLLLDKIGLKVDANFMEFMMPMEETSIVFAKTDSSQKDKYSFYYFPFMTSISHKTKVSEVSYLENKLPNTVIAKIGNGKLIINSSPRSLGNYFLLTRQNYNYFNKLIAELPAEPDDIFWDNYYTKNFGNKGNPSSLWKALKKYPTLMKALSLSALLLLLYIFFDSKRRQRIVAVKKPNENSSIKYAEALAGLYYSEKSHANIAQKMIAYFHEHLRNRYFVNTNHLTDEYIQSISSKSGYDLQKTTQLYDTIKSVLQGNEVTENKLLLLNEQIQQFLKTTT